MSIFTKEQKRKVGSNTFNLTHDRKTTMQIGRIIPVQVQEAIPGDKFSLKTSAMVRFAPMIAPIMHLVNMSVHHFFVPNRLLWDGWEEFARGTKPNSENPAPGTPWTTRTHPYYNINVKNVEIGDLADHLGVPTKEDAVHIGEVGEAFVEINALPFKAYHLIYDEYYRDRDLDLSAEFTKAIDGLQGGAVPNLKWRAYSKDYFTSARPWPQKGPESMLPIGDGEVVNKEANKRGAARWLTLSGGFPSDGAVSIASDGQTQDDLNDDIWYDPNGSLKVDFDDASIVNLRRAIALQNFLEISNRFGGRYNEHIYGQFGVTTSDQRIQRPEFIGGFKSPVKISEVLNTTGAINTETDGGQDFLPQGNMAGHGMGYGGSKPAMYFAEEYGIVMTLMTIVPKPGYQQGIPRLLMKNDTFDYALPAFAHIGEQAIYNQELGWDATSQDNKATWGYTPRYAEYKWTPSTVHGYFRSSMDKWHMNRKFSNVPALSDQFLQIGNVDDINRIFSVDPQQYGEDPVWVQVLNETKVSRKLPYFGNPKII